MGGLLLMSTVGGDGAGGVCTVIDMLHVVGMRHLTPLGGGGDIMSTNVPVHEGERVHMSHLYYPPVTIAVSAFIHLLLHVPPRHADPPSAIGHFCGCLPHELDVVAQVECILPPLFCISPDVRGEVTIRPLTRTFLPLLR